MLDFLRTLGRLLSRVFQALFGRPRRPSDDIRPPEDRTRRVTLLDVEFDGGDFRCPDATAGHAAFRLVERADCTLDVHVRIRLTKYDPNPLLLPWTAEDDELLDRRKTEWKDRIETLWSNRFRLKWTHDLLPPHRPDDRLSFPHCDLFSATRFHVEWLDANDPTPAHHEVEVRRHQGLITARVWQLGDDSSSAYVDSVAHEFGHLLGLCHDLAPEESIMTTGTPGNDVLCHHYKPIASVLTRYTPNEYVVEDCP